MTINIEAAVWLFGSVGFVACLLGMMFVATLFVLLTASVCESIYLKYQEIRYGNKFVTDAIREKFVRDGKGWREEKRDDGSKQ